VRATRFIRGSLKPCFELRYFRAPSIDRFLAVQLRGIIFCGTPGATSQQLSSRQRYGRSNGGNEIEIISHALVRNARNVKRIGSDVYLAIICGKMICPASLRSPLFSSLFSGATGGIVLLEKYGGHGSRGKGQNNTLYALYLRLICKFSGDFITSRLPDSKNVRTF